MLRLERISKVYPTGEVLKDVNWEVKPGDRVGLVGVNGAGKTTQLKIIMGAIEPTSGAVVRPASLKIACLSQEFDVDPQNTVRQELWTVFDEANRIQRELDRVQHQMETATPEELDDLIHQLDRYQQKFEALNGYGLDARISKLLPDIGFEPEMDESLVNSFSGGWQMRLCLGKVMLQEPDLLLLDEPTNHLDLETIEWLEGYLKNLTTPMVVVSHDRAFLDRLCTSIVETERGVSSTYLGNYSSYLEQKQMDREAQLSAYERQQKEIDKQQAFVERFRASATRSTQAKSREKQLEKIERIEAPTGDVRTLHFRFPTAPRSGREVVKITDLTHMAGDKLLFLGTNLLVERGDRIAFLGPNGAGKSTLLRLIMGIEKPTEGTVALGEHGVVPGYFEQNQAEALDLEKTVIQTIEQAVPDWKYEDIRALLGKFLFGGETVNKKVGALS
ncbi:MAG: ABC-F family ATP-binding cassette domain-containing protein, partial [Coleofasciculaceae cyanobacterium SM2_3_26]|nr:ABC-F family ATP-binding cassette domain-containing protein [Coleofasciculaceae cyanobacterium SM2_3_26]